MDKTPQSPSSQQFVPINNETRGGITQESIAFFREKNQFLTPAQYAKIEAARNHPLSEWRKWWNIAFIDVALWPVFSIALAATYLLWQGYHLHYDRIVLLMLVAFIFTSGIMMTHAAMLNRSELQIEAYGLPRARVVPVGISLLVLSVLLGIVELAHKVSQTGTTALIIGLLLGVVYGIGIPLLQSGIIGEEFIPAIGAGPLLFFYTIASQHLTTIITMPAIKKIPAHTVIRDVPLYTHTAWLIAVGIGILFLTGAIASHMLEGSASGKYTLKAVIPRQYIKYIYLLSMFAGYFLLMLAGFTKYGPHPLLIVLLTLPMMIIPVTGILRANAENSMRIIVYQTGSVIRGVMVAANIGFVLGWVYLELITRLHQSLK